MNEKPVTLEGNESYNELIENGNIDAYQDLASFTAIYPEESSITYPLLGLIGEVGEFANKYKKVIRDGQEFSRDDMSAELGDILWYFAAICNDANLSMGQIAVLNIKKLYDRKERGVLGGSGDNR